MKIAVVQVRGIIGTSKKIRDSLKMLNLHRKNSCVVVENTPSSLGMLNLLKDFITWGEIDEETLYLLLEKRGRVVGNKLLTDEYLKKNVKIDLKELSSSLFNGKVKLKDVPGLKSFFRLCPPVRGFERAGVKKPFSMGGALGYRKEKINDLVRRML